MLASAGMLPMAAAWTSSASSAARATPSGGGHSGAAAISMHASQSVVMRRRPTNAVSSGVQHNQRREFTRALFWTESYYDPDVKRWVGRVQTAEAHQMQTPRTVGHGLRNPTALAVDSLSRNVFWTDWGDSTITRCDLAHPEAEPTMTTIGDGLFGRRMHDGPWGLVLDASTNTLVWSEAGGSALRKASYDGSCVGMLSHGDRTSWSATGPWGLALQLRPGCVTASSTSAASREPSSLPVQHGVGSIFWTSWGRIQQCDLGTGCVRDVVRGLIDPTGLILDPRHGGRLFWTDAKAGKVQCSAIDGSRVCDVATGLDEPFGLALGPTHLFWTDRRRGAIQSCCMRTGAIRDVVTGLCAPEGIGALTESAPVRYRPRTTTADAPAARQRQQLPKQRYLRHRSVDAADPLPPIRQASAVLFAPPSKAHAVVRSHRRVTKHTLTEAEILAAATPPSVQPAPPSDGQVTAPPSVQEIMRRSATALQEMQQRDVVTRGVQDVSTYK